MDETIVKPAEQTEKPIKPYNYGLDIIRILAMFFVILVHSTTFYGFTQEGVNSFVMFLVGMGRYLSFSCVPLFIVLTGYLNYNKQPTIKYYLKIFRILLEYLLCGVAVAIFNKLCFSDPTPLPTIIERMFSFKLPAYSWYINMFVGLFLIAPFLNYGFKAIPEKQKWIFMVVLLLIFSNPQLTSYWTSSYPLMYYFIGCFIYEKQFKVNKLYLGLTIFVLTITQTLLFMFPVIPTYSVENHNNLGCIIITVSLFLMFYNLTLIKNTKAKTLTTKTFRLIANASLATFLISVIFESLTQELFKKLTLTTFSSRLTRLMYLTPLKFVLSVLCGITIHLISVLIIKLITLIVKKIKTKKRPS